MPTTLTLSTLESLRRLVRPVEPMVSVYAAGASMPPADMTEDRALRLRAIGARLREQGADDPTVTAVGDYLRRLPYPAETAVFAADGEVRWTQALPGGVPRDLARFGVPAMVTPILKWLQGNPAHVIVIIDRVGADVTAVPVGAVDAVTTSVAGPDDEIERNAPGGWAQARHQRRAEDSWLHNAAAIADAVAKQLAAVHADLVIMAGDVRACQLLAERFSRAGIPPQIRQIPGGRSPDGSAAHRADAVRAVLDEYAAAQQEALLRRFAAASGMPHTAVSGVEQTLSALAAGQVETLLVVDRPDDDRLAWFTAEGWCGAAGGDSLPADAVRGRLIDVAVRAALLSHAGVHVLPGTLDLELADGIGAICRFR